MRTIRLDIETREKDFLSPAAAFSADSKGTVYPREKDDIRTIYMQDRDRIVHSEYFRRLKDKAQVIMLSVGDFRTRLTHTLEVMQIARSIARALRLNEDLTEAIAFGHDLGHSPFGHAGEKAISKYFKGFHHSSHSLRVVEHLEKGRHTGFGVGGELLFHGHGVNQGPHGITGVAINGGCYSTMLDGQIGFHLGGSGGCNQQAVCGKHVLFSPPYK